MSTSDSKKHFIDFVAELPYDIIPTILSYLPIEQLMECLHVSPVWNSRLLSSASLWREVKISNGEASRVETLERVAPLIKKLTVCEDADLEATFRFLSDCDFDNLRSLEVFELEMPGFNVYDDHIYPALSNVGGFLEEISLAYLDSVQIPFTRILNYCPNLERLKFNGYGSDIISPATAYPATISKLTHAFIHIDTSVDPGELRRLLQRSPKLQQLHISYCSEEILDIILDFCPDLQYLNYNMAAVQVQNDVRMEFADFNVGNERGLRVLNVVANSEPERLNAAQFTQRSPVLEEFGFYIPWGTHLIPDFTRFASKNLQRFYCNAPIDQTTLSSIASQCPLVQDVMITQTNVECLLLLIARFTRLHRLHLKEGNGIEEQDMERFLKGCRLSNTLVLNTLVLEECTSLTDSVISYLADLPTLLEITLKSNDNVTEAGMNAFAEKLPFSNVKRIRFESMDSVTDATVARLGAGRLETVSLLGLDHVTFHGLCELVDHAPSLRQLHVFQCGVIQDSALSVLGIEVCTTESLP